MYSRNLGSNKATSNLFLHLKESLIHFVLCFRYVMWGSWGTEKSHPDKSHPDKSPPNMRQKPPQIRKHIFTFVKDMFSYKLCIILWCIYIYMYVCI